jgi:putative glutamine amidotransferase
MPPTEPLLIGVSARIHYPRSDDAARHGVYTKTLHFLEQSVAHWLLHGGQSQAMPVMVPAVSEGSLVTAAELHLERYAQALDGLVLQGGNDVAPQQYGQQPLKPEWAGDPVRDAYEIALIRAFVAAGKPVFGICRGLQILNVAFGGTLWQDIPTQRPDALQHVQIGRYENHFHAVEIVPGTRLAQLYPSLPRTVTNSIHHQAIRDLAPGFVVEARCPDDGIVEAIRRHPDAGPGLVAGVQWHPEFHRADDPTTLDDTPLLQDFLAAAQAARAGRGARTTHRSG